LRASKAARRFPPTVIRGGRGIRLTCQLERFPTLGYTAGAPRTVASALEKYETAGGLQREEERSVEGERTGWKATGKAFFHMLIQQAGCAHEYLWSKRAFLSPSLLPLPLPPRRYFCSLSLSRCIHVVPKFSPFLSTADGKLSELACRDVDL